MPLALAPGAVLVVAVFLGGGPGSAGPVRFGRDVLPVLSQNCFQCHGPDERARKAGLRLDTRAGARAVVTRGRGGQSELVRRITAPSGRGRMPPPRTGRTLTAAQQDLLRRWIDEGASWGTHWAYEAPTRPALPNVRRAGWARNPIDSFVLARLEREGRAPSAEASRETLVRRVTLDLTGLPPTPAEVDAFLADRGPGAYERVVDRLLASPRYGERMAMDWLDAARYADTNGYQNDFARAMWPWRDRVVASFNRNQPFDRFAVEQLAGDRLPGATREQKIASGFNRNNRTVTEAGSIDEEWRVENAVDRVETTATVFLGLTLGCARCHDHKYDPVTQREFYEFLAFFNSVNEKGVYTEQKGNVPPLVAVPGPRDEERLRQWDADIAAARAALGAEEARLPAEQERWERGREGGSAPAQPCDWALRLPLDGNARFTDAAGKGGEAKYRGGGGPAWSEGPWGKALRLDGRDTSFFDLGQAVGVDRGDRISYGGWVKPEGDGAVVSKMDDGAAYRGFDLLLTEGKAAVHLVHRWPDSALKVVTRERLPADAWTHVFATYDGSGKAGGVAIYFNGRPVPLAVEADQLRGSVATSQPLRLGKRSAGAALAGELADVRIYRRTLLAGDVEALALAPVDRVLRVPRSERTPAQRALLAGIFRGSYARGLREARSRVEALGRERAAYEQGIPTVMVMEDRPTPRPTFVLKRGRYEMPDRTRPVAPGVPTCLPPLPAKAPRDRLGLAEWLVAPENPLAARVTVNRYWQNYFGTGLVKTAENFGVQGEPPSHPELLDWLATEFVRTGWDVKGMQRLIVTSATYRQASGAGPELLKSDPENRLLARGPRVRLPAEVVRDNALAVAGLLTERLGGPPVKPYQPAGLWEELAGGAGEGPYVEDKGPALYRRSLYVYRKRTAPHPALATFDAPGREICQVRRSRTNTPLQALQLLNDVTYVEAARRLAERMLTEGGRTPEGRITLAFRRATGRAPTAPEMKVLAGGLKRYEGMFRADPGAAGRFVRHGDSAPRADVDPVELAAYTATAAVILNLDETITKE